MVALTFVVSFLLDMSVPKKKEENLILNLKSFANQFKCFLSICDHYAKLTEFERTPF